MRNGGRNNFQYANVLNFERIFHVNQSILIKGNQKRGGDILAIEKVGTINYKDLPPLDAETAKNMSEELRISVILSILYYAFLLAVTIMNFTAPEFMKTKLWGGMTVTWFATSLVSLAVASLVAWVHVIYYQKRVLENSKNQGVV